MSNSQSEAALISNVTYAWRPALTRLALTLRRDGLTILGLAELFDAVRLVEEPPPVGHPFHQVVNNPEILKEAVLLLWCKTMQDADLLAKHWPQAVRNAEQQIPSPVAEELHEESVDVHEPFQQTNPPPIVPPSSPASPTDATLTESAEREARLGVLATRPPAPVTNMDMDPAAEAALGAYGPVSRRTLSYVWRSIRQPVPDGPRNVIDVQTTVNRAARTGFFTGLAYRRVERDEAQIILLVDQRGSMTPFHRLTRDVVETAHEARPHNWMVAYYFQNVPAEYVYRNPHLTLNRRLSDVLEGCGRETAILIISDAGAARGHLRRERVRETARILHRLRSRTDRIAWLNPMPHERWTGSSAEIIAELVAMFPMDTEGVADAVDVLRGQLRQTLDLLAA